MYETSDVDITSNNFVHIYTQLFNECCPVRKYTYNKVFSDKPWFTQGLVNTCKKRINYTEIFFGAD